MRCQLVHLAILQIGALLENEEEQKDEEKKKLPGNG